MVEVDSKVKAKTETRTTAVHRTRQGQGQQRGQGLTLGNDAGELVVHAALAQEALGQRHHRRHLAPLYVHGNGLVVAPLRVSGGLDTRHSGERDVGVGELGKGGGLLPATGRLHAVQCSLVAGGPAAAGRELGLSRGRRPDPNLTVT